MTTVKREVKTMNRRDSFKMAAGLASLLALGGFATLLRAPSSNSIPG